MPPHGSAGRAELVPRSARRGQRSPSRSARGRSGETRRREPPRRGDGQSRSPVLGRRRASPSRSPARGSPRGRRAPRRSLSGDPALPLPFEQRVESRVASLRERARAHRSAGAADPGRDDVAAAADLALGFEPRRSAADRSQADSIANAALQAWEDRGGAGVGARALPDARTPATVPAHLPPIPPLLLGGEGEGYAALAARALGPELRHLLSEHDSSNDGDSASEALFGGPSGEALAHVPLGLGEADPYFREPSGSAAGRVALAFEDPVGNEGARSRARSARGVLLGAIVAPGEKLPPFPPAAPGGQGGLLLGAIGDARAELGGAENDARFHVSPTPRAERRDERP